jgi:hypothetical protein
MAGFPSNDRFFHLAHAALDPSTNLCKKFPAIDEWITMLRKTFIQDSVLMMELAPAIPFGNIQIFSDSAYLSFKR